MIQGWASLTRDANSFVTFEGRISDGGINLQSQGNPFQPPFPNAESPIDELSAVCQAKLTR